MFRNIAAAAALSLALVAGAVPAKRGIYTTTAPDGSTVSYSVSGDAHHRYYFTPDSILLHMSPDGILTYGRLDASARVVSTGVVARDGLRYEGAVNLGEAAVAAARVAKSPARVPANMLTTTFPGKGSPRALVVLVEFADLGFTVPDPKAHFEAMLSQEGYNAYGGVGSALDYFTQCSDGQFTPQFDVYGPVTLSKKQSYYGQNNSAGDDAYAHEMAIEACRQLDDVIDFNDYDTDGDGFVDNVYVFHAGFGEADNLKITWLVWPHSYDITALGESVQLDGVFLNHYACSNELNADRTPAGIGTFVHEFSHVLGLPDLYCTTRYASPYTPGEWSVLDYGPYNGDGRVPPLYGAFERLSLGWMEPRLLSDPDNITLLPISENDACIVQTETDNDFFLFENRQPTGFDAELPGHGMLVWHIDYNRAKWSYNNVNNSSSHQNVDLVEADGSTSSSKSSRASEAFPGTLGKTSFTDTTRPAMKSWNGKAQNTPVTDIAESADGIITFKVKGGKVDGIADATLAADDCAISVDGRRVSGASEVSVYTTAGALVGRGRSVTVPAAGMYIARCGSRAERISVR